MKILLLLSILTLSLSCLAQKEIKLEELKDHIGDNVIVQGTIWGITYSKSEKNKPTYIYLGGVYPNQFLTVVLTDNIKRRLHYIPTEQKDKGDIARITGKVELYKNELQIVVRDPKQLEILMEVTETVTN